jgi:hypothetical protein
MNRVRMEHRASLSAAEREMERIELRRKKLIEMVMDGVAPSVVKDELNANAARREQLEAQLAAAGEPSPLLHPEMARIYRAKVTELGKALQEPDSQSPFRTAPRRTRTGRCGHPSPVLALARATCTRSFPADSLDVSSRRRPS